MPNPNVTPLAQDFTIAAQVPDPSLYFFHDPNLARLDDGTLIVAAPEWGRRHTNLGRSLRMVRSTDGGKTWDDLPTLPYEEGRPFVVDGKLLMFVRERTHRDFQIVTSDDQGETWTEPRTVIEGPLWNISTAQLIWPDALYWAMDKDSSAVDYKGKVMVRWDRARSALDPAAWSISNIVPPPEVPVALTRELFPLDDRPQIRRGWPAPFVWLEPNTVEVAGRIRVFARAIIDEKATANIAAVLDYDEASQQASASPSSRPGPAASASSSSSTTGPTACTGCSATSSPTPRTSSVGATACARPATPAAPATSAAGSSCTTASTASTGSPPAASPAGPTASTAASCTPSAVIDGPDLVILSRTSHDAANQHDADLCTIHRIPNFRSLAMDLHQGGLAP